MTEHENYYQQHEVRLCEAEQRLARVGKGGPASSQVDSLNRKLNDMQSTLHHLDKKLRSDAKKQQVRPRTCPEPLMSSTWLFGPLRRCHYYIPLWTFFSRHMHDLETCEIVDESSSSMKGEHILGGAGEAGSTCCTAAGHEQEA